MDPYPAGTLPAGASAASSCAAATTGGAKRRPGELPSLLAGPDTQRAPSSAPSRSTGALTLATPGSRSAMLDAHPRRRTAASSAAGTAGKRSASGDHASRIFPPEPGVERQQRADRDAIAQARARVPGGNAQPPVTGAQVQLRALAGLLVQPVEHGGGQRAEVDPGPGPQGELGEPRPEPERAVAVPPDQAVALERDQQPVGRRPGQPAGLGQRPQRPRPVAEQLEQGHGPVQHAHPADPVAARAGLT